MDPQEESSESVPGSDGWDPVPGSTGRQAADSLGEDEMPRDRARVRSFSKKGSTKRSTIKCVKHPGQTRTKRKIDWRSRH